ncbi:hypothetical protein [Kingella oralis]|uniref:Uncharacterized protein n=1 Tax=Kingella oralis ATCC 51147 TaxID=629741 RepID=C4GLB4_9NEIS|nr:hypothetical protein [Kingella oralis]EEP67523.1 hypothetical protein GCWU000324_01771 [Kingella oralis ATCC 51147]QMT43576.1 hypothetical protein H3L93_04390 [Kingella oralis]
MPNLQTCHTHQRQPENLKMERRQLADICCLHPRMVDDTSSRRVCSFAAHAVYTPCHIHQRQPEKQNRLVLSQTIFYWIN